MAFTSRAKRDIDLSIRSTPDTVGPGSYRVEDQSALKKVRQYARAPFSSTSRRRSSFTSDVPGPGSYDDPTPQLARPKSVGSVFQSRTERFKSMEPDDTPGPGSYGVDKMAPWTVHGRRMHRMKKIAASQRIEEQKKKQLMLRNIRTAPSIPARHQSYGYVEGPDGKLRREGPPVAGHSGTPNDIAGPGAYEVALDTIGSTVKKRSALRGSSSFASSSTRDAFQGLVKTDVPGPTDYFREQQSDANKNKTSSSGNSKMSAVFASTTGRSNWIGNKDDVPAPGIYGTDTAFKQYYVPQHLQNFGSNAPRLTDSSGINRLKDPTPGPGHFYTSDKPAHWKRLMRKSAVVPFNARSARFVSETKPKHDVPPPGAYNISGFVEESAKRINPGSFGVFGSTSRRFDSIQDKRTKGSLGPGWYDPKLPQEAFKPRKKDPRTSSFIPPQHAPRIRKEAPTTTPGPGQYEIRKSFIDTRPGPVSPEGHIFGLGKRFEFKTSRIPGPGSYNADESFQKVFNKKHGKSYVKVPFMRSSQRFTPGEGIEAKRDMEDLGPGYYHVESPWIRRSFNATIDSQELII